jgi:hypothetical protein
MNILVIRDPDEEEKRQKQERTDLPSLIQKSRDQMEIYTNSPFDRTGLISELHYGQIISSIQRNTHTVLKTEHMDTFAAPTAYTEEKDPNLLYLLSRYNSHSLPKRDTEFLLKVKDILTRGISSVGKRATRIAQRQHLEDDLKVLSTSTDVAEDVSIQGVLDVEQSFKCTVQIFYLQPDGKLFAEVATNSKKKNLADELEYSNELVNYAMKICRHGVILQIYRGVISIVDFEWSNLSQMGVVSLESVSDSIDDVEGNKATYLTIQLSIISHTNIILSFSIGSGICKKITSLSSQLAPDGCYVVPLISPGEVVTGVIFMTGVDKIPHAVYNFKPTLQKSTSESNRNRGFIEIKAPEDGVSSAVVSVGKYLGMGLLSARIGDALNKVKKIPISAYSKEEELLRFSFRMIITAIPAIRELSIWGIYMDKKIVVASFKSDEPEEVKKGLFSSIFGKAKPPPVVKVKKKTYLNPSDPHACPIVAGFFHSESPSVIMNTSVEDFTKKKTSTKNKEDHIVIINGNVKNAIDQSREKEIGKDEIVSWGVGVPNAMMKEKEDSNDVVISDNSDNSPILQPKEVKYEVVEDAINLIHSEACRYIIIFIFYLYYLLLYIFNLKNRCIRELKMKTFRVATGQVLSTVGLEEASHKVFDNFFDPTFNKLKNDIEENKRKLIFERYEFEMAAKEKRKEDNKTAYRKKMGLVQWEDVSDKELEIYLKSTNKSVDSKGNKIESIFFEEKEFDFAYDSEEEYNRFVRKNYVSTWKEDDKDTEKNKKTIEIKKEKKDLKKNKSESSKKIKRPPPPPPPTPPSSNVQSSPRGVGIAGTANITKNTTSSEQKEKGQAPKAPLPTIPRGFNKDKRKKDTSSNSYKREFFLSASTHGKYYNFIIYLFIYHYYFNYLFIIY